MSFLIKFVIAYLLVFAVFAFVIDFVDEHAVDIWNKILEKYDELWDKIDQFISERSENEGE